MSLFNAKSHPEAWWELFVGVMESAISSTQDLLRCRDKAQAQQLCEAAANLADAALREFEERKRSMK